MVWDQARAKQLMSELDDGGRGGRHPAGGAAAQTASPHPRLKARPSWTGIVLVGFTILPIALSVFLAKKPRREVGTPPPQTQPPVPETVKAAAEEPVKEALGAALKEVPSLSVRDQKNRLLGTC